MLHAMETDIDVLSGAIKIFRRREGDETTGGKQNAKRSQWAGRFKVDRTRQKNNFRESSDLSKVLRGGNRFKGEFAIDVASVGVKENGSKSPIAKGQERVYGVCAVLVNRAVRSRGS